MNDSVDNAMDTILKDDNVVVQIRESQFVEKILPIIKDDKGELSLDPWLDISGSWVRDIEVVDDNDRTLVLFRVPSIVARAKEPAGKGRGQSAYDIIRDVERKMGTLPQVANQMLKTRLKDRVVPEDNIDETKRNWEIICKRYGIADTAIDTSTSDVDAPVTKENVLGYDD